MTEVLCGCCKQQSRELLAVAAQTPLHGYVAMSLCSGCRFSHWKRRAGHYHHALPVFEPVAPCSRRWPAAR